MWGLAAAAVLTYGLIRAAVAEPSRKAAFRAAKLRRLLRKPANRLTLDEAADGVVLARAAGLSKQTRIFESRVSELKRQKGKK
jgi:hypothetical protein